MRIFASLRIAGRALRRNKMRSLLTMLGIISGVGAVIGSVSLTTGATKQVEDQVASLGENVITVFSGNFTQGGATLAFSMKRTGAAQFAELPKSTFVAKVFEGAWEGTLDANGTKLRLMLNLVNGKDSATGTLTSVDQQGIVIPIAVITQTKSELKLDLPSISGNFKGEIGKDAASITGTWTQGMGALPLTLRRPAAAK